MCRQRLSLLIGLSLYPCLLSVALRCASSEYDPSDCWDVKSSTRKSYTCKVSLAYDCANENVTNAYETIYRIEDMREVDFCLQYRRCEMHDDK